MGEKEKINELLFARYVSNHLNLRAEDISKEFRLTAGRCCVIGKKIRIYSCKKSLVYIDESEINMNISKDRGWSKKGRDIVV